MLLDAIWRHGPISRKGLAELTGLTGASTSRLTKRILEMDLIDESVHLDGTVGSPRRPLIRSKSETYTVGISFTKKSMNLAIVNLEGKICEAANIEISSVSVSALSDFTNDTLKSSAVLQSSKARILGVGLAVPGYRATLPGQWAVHWDFPELLRINIENELSEKLKLPVFAERDAIACAWAERLNGKGRILQNFCTLYLAQGVGGGIMSDGRPIKGQNGNAGGLGILFPYDSPRPSSYDFEAHLSKAGLTLESLDPKLNRHLGIMDSWVKKITPILRLGLNHLSRLYDPEMIILCGSLPRFVLDRLVIAASFSRVQADYSAELPPPIVSVTDITENCLLQGASTLPIAQILSTSW